MGINIQRKDFEEIYNNTYEIVLKFAIIKSNNIDDVKDIIQDTYLELLKIIKRKKYLELENVNNFIFGIENNIIKRHYSKRKKNNLISFYVDDELKEKIPDKFDLEINIINKNNVSEIWDFLKKRDLLTTKIFYLHFVIGMKITEIAKELELGESNIKNRIYRTLREIKKSFGKDVIKND